MDFYTILGIVIIGFVLYMLFYKKTNKKEHFRSLSKSLKKATKSVGKTIKKTTSSASKTVSSVSKTATKAANKAAKTASRAAKALVTVNSAAVLNAFNDTRIRVRQTQRLVNSTTKMSNDINEMIGTLKKRLEQLPTKATIVIQKRIFTLYLIKKTQTKIQYVNNLIIFTSNIAASKSSRTPAQVEALRKVINKQINAIKIYIGKTNSYICQTLNAYYQLEESYNQIVAIYSDLINQIKRYDMFREETTKSVNTTNNLINTTNLQIQQAQSPQETSVDSESETGSEGTSQEEATATSTAAATTEESDGGEDVEEGFAVADISPFDTLSFNLETITIPSNITIPPRSSFPIISSNELVVPVFVTPTLNFDSQLILSSAAPAPAPASAPTFSESSESYQAETEILDIAPIEENVPIPTDADPADINAENELIFELS